MMQNQKALWRRAHKNERGQVLIGLTLWLTILFGVTALVVDMGFIYVYQSELDASTQAAALAGAYAMSQLNATTDSTTAVVTSYSGVSGNKNNALNLRTVAMMTGYPQFKCLSTVTSVFGVQCYGPSGSNAIVVKQHVVVPLFFMPLFGGKTAVLSSTATAAMKGSQAAPYNVAIVLDSTQSMRNTDSDSNCHDTRMSCALAGVRTLLGNLAPCSQTLSNCGSVTGGNVANSVDRVSLFTFPPVASDRVANDYNCSGNSPNIVNYAWPFPGGSTYQIVNFSSDYRTSDTAASLSSSSNLVAAVGGKGGCSPMQAIGGVGTYYAQAIYTAQASLAAEKVLFPQAQNVMIILGDGDMNATGAHMPGASPTSGTYPSVKQQCHQAITAAQAAAAAGTRVYSIAYGAGTSGCATDTAPTITACQTMQQMASSSAYFFSDYTATGGSTSCTSAAQPVTGLNQIFQVISGDLSQVKLIPNGTT